MVGRTADKELFWIAVSVKKKKKKFKKCRHHVSLCLLRSGPHAVVLMS